MPKLHRIKNVPRVLKWRERNAPLVDEDFGTDEDFIYGIAPVSFEEAFGPDMSEDESMDWYDDYLYSLDDYLGDIMEWDDFMEPDEPYDDDPLDAYYDDLEYEAMRRDPMTGSTYDDWYE